MEKMQKDHKEKKTIPTTNRISIKTIKPQKKKKKDKAVNVFKVFPTEESNLENIIPITSKNGYSVTKNTIRGYATVKEDKKRKILLTYYIDPFYKNIQNNSKIKKIEFLHNYTIMGIENEIEEKIIIFHNEKFVKEIITSSSSDFIVFDAFCIQSVAIVHQLPPNSLNYRNIEIFWLYKIRKKIMIPKIFLLEGKEENAQIRKKDEFTLMVISQKNVRTYTRGMKSNGHFDLNEIGCSMIFGLYSHHEIENSIITQDYQKMILDVKEKIGEGYKYFHSVHDLSDLFMIEEVDSSLDKVWRPTGKYLHTGVWSSPEGAGYILYFLSQRDNGVYLSFAYLTQYGLFHGANITLKIVKPEKNKIFNFRFISFRKVLNDEEVFLFEFSLDEKINILQLEIDFAKLFNKARNEEMSRSLYDSATEGVSHSIFSQHELMNSHDVKEIELGRLLREKYSGKDLCPKLTTALERFKIKFDGKFTKLGLENRIHFNTGKEKQLRSKTVTDEPMDSIIFVPDFENGFYKVKIDVKNLKNHKTKETNSAYIDSDIEEFQSNRAVKPKDDFPEREENLTKFEKKIMNFKKNKNKKDRKKMGGFCSDNQCLLI